MNIEQPETYRTPAENALWWVSVNFLSKKDQISGISSCKLTLRRAENTTNLVLCLAGVQLLHH